MSNDNEGEPNGLQILDEEMDIEEQQEKTTFDIVELGQALKVASGGPLQPRLCRLIEGILPLVPAALSIVPWWLLTVGKYVESLFQICCRPR